MRNGIRGASAVAVGAATVALLGLAAPAQAAASPNGAEHASSASAAPSPAFLAALAEGRTVASPDYCYAHANDGGCQ